MRLSDSIKVFDTNIEAKEQKSLKHIIEVYMVWMDTCACVKEAKYYSV